MIFQPTKRTEYLVLDFDTLWLSLATCRGLIRSDGVEYQGEFCKGVYFDEEISVKP